MHYAEPNYLVQIQARAERSALLEPLGHAEHTGQLVNNHLGACPGADIDAPSAWDITTGSAANVVAVVDTGIDYTHPDLAANVWSAPAPFSVTLGGVTISCAAGTHGFNAIKKTCDPKDDNNHGTHVSGTIGAVGNNGMGVAGVNWTASVMGAKFLDATGCGTTADAINAIDFAIQASQALGPGANVRVLSNSWVLTGPHRRCSTRSSRPPNKMLFVAAAGNSGSNNDTAPVYPSNYTRRTWWRRGHRRP